MEGQIRQVIREKIASSIRTGPPILTRRDVRLPQVRGKAIAVIGMRRTGKSTFLWQVLKDKLERGADRETLLYFSFEDERLSEMTSTDLQILLEEYYRLVPQLRDARTAVFFLDEIQVIPGWESFTRRILDTEKIQLFISGSSARLLSREVATSMRGRAMEALVQPFSFREYLRHLGREPEAEPERLAKAQRSELEKDLRDYLRCGGFPESIGIVERDRFELLKGYIDSCLLRDVIERHEVSHPLPLRWMVRQLLSNAAGTFSINKFYNDLKSQGIAVGKDTLHEYLGYLEDAFLLRTLTISASSERRRMVNQRKVYPVDPGLIPLFEVGDRSNVGHSLETCVMLELERRGAETFYVRNSTGSEVDFVARYPDGTRELIQVTTDLSSPDVRMREFRGLTDGLAENKGVSAHLIVLEPEFPGTPPPLVNIHRASDWMLSAHRA